MQVIYEPIGELNREAFCRLHEESWGSALVVSRGKVHETAGLSGFLALLEGRVVGYITYDIMGDQMEIVSFESFLQRHGIGGILVQMVLGLARRVGCKRVWLITTNDNTHAMRYYQKRGFDMVAVHRNAIDEVRRIKPQIPMGGIDGIPIRHEIEFEFWL